MKIKKKRGIRKVRITHNKSLLYVILVLLILFVIVVILAFKTNSYECKNDMDCVKDSCCHAQTCVAKQNAPNCSDIFCDQVCSSVLDCNQASCSCVKNKCQVIKNT